MDYYERKTHTFTCRHCSWRGLGSELEIHEVYEEIVEWECPKCGERIGFSAFPNREETQAAADRGDEDAVKALPEFDRREKRWQRVLETRASEVAAPAELDHGDVRCMLTTVKSDDGETWQVLTANGREIHRELAVYESDEPALRLLTLLQKRYGKRLRSFNCDIATVQYICGDKGSPEELWKRVAKLPEGTGSTRPWWQAP